MYNQYNITDRMTERGFSQVSPQPLIQQVADDRILHRAYTWLRAQHPGTVPPWDDFKSSLPQKLLSGEYCFQPVILATLPNRLGELEAREVWQAQDLLVLKAISLVLTDHLQADFSTGCHHFDGRTGMKQTLRQTRDYLHNHPNSWVMTIDVKGYYTNLDHSILYQQLQDLFPQETYLLRLLWQSLKRTVSADGNYEDIERGTSLGSPLSPLLVALYLKPLDDYFAGTTPNPSSSPRRGTDFSQPYQGVAGTTSNPSSPRRGTDFSQPYQGGAGGGFFYARFMDEWVLLAPTRWQLRSTVAQSHLLLEQLQLSQAPDNTFLGQASHGFDFLGYHLTPTQLTSSKTALQRRDARLHPLLDGHGANDLRVGESVSRWQRWTKAGWNGSLTETADFNLPPRGRLPSNLPLEAKFLALGAASLLGATASDSQATIWYADLSTNTSPIIGASVDLDCDHVIDVVGKQRLFPSISSGVRRVSWTVSGGAFLGVQGMSSCAQSVSAAHVNRVTCVAGIYSHHRHYFWSNSSNQYHWLSVKGTSGKFGLLRIVVDASKTTTGGIITGRAYDDSGAVLLPSNVPTTPNTPDGCPPPPQINVKGNGISIANGATTPTTTNNTDFGNVTVGNSISNTFTIENTGNLTLTLSAGAFTPANCNSVFSLVTQPATSIAGGGSSSFVLKYTPSAISTDTCTANISSNDSTKNPYQFVVQGTGVAVPTYTVTPATGGTGTGTVSGMSSYIAGAMVTLTANPTNGSTFTGWSPLPCAASFAMPANNLTCTATFAAATTPTTPVTPVTPVTPPSPPSSPPDPTKVGFFLKVDGNGSGQVTTDAGVSCQTSDCHADNSDGNSSGVACNASCQTVIDNSAGPTTVTLTPKAAYGSYFAGWGGHPDCVDGQLTVTEGRLCIAFFDKEQATLFLTTDGTGQGQVAVDVGKLDWTSNHEAHGSYDVGTKVTLTATAQPGSYLVGWGGDEDCVDGQVEMQSNRACVAHFNLNAEPTHSLPTEANPTPLPNPPAPVTTTPATTPPASTTPTTTTDVTTTPATTPPASTTPTTETLPTAVATQAVVAAPITLITAKLGPGNLRSNPTGIECGTTCQASYPAGTAVTLTATPTDGATFKEWSGDCNSTEVTVTVTPKTDIHCQATFEEATPGGVTPAPVPVTPTVVTSPSVPVTTPAETSPTGAATTPVVPPTPVVVTPPPVTTLVPVTIAAANFSCATTGDIGETCNYGGREVTNLNVQGSGTVSNGLLNTTVVNTGWVSNFHITATGKLSGGVVTGYIVNEGVMLDFEFVGMSIIGGTLGGVIQNNSRVGGYFQDVTLLPNTKITGGVLSGIIKGDKDKPALLENVRVKGRSKLSGVKLGTNVKLEKGVVVEEKQ